MRCSSLGSRVLSLGTFYLDADWWIDALTGKGRSNTAVPLLEMSVMSRLSLLISLFVCSAANAQDPVLLLNPQGDDQHPVYVQAHILLDS